MLFTQTVPISFVYLAKLLIFKLFKFVILKNSVLLHNRITNNNNILLLISGIVVGVTLPVLGYYLYWYIGLVMEENELHKDNTDER